MIDVRAIEASTLDGSLKGYPHRAPPCAVSDIGTRGWNVIRGDLPFPVALLKETALAHNLAWMADFTRATGVLIAPHGKTTMAPQLFARQLEAGAWGITLATMQQVSLSVAAGLRRVILANQLVGREDIAQARELIASTPGLELHILVDSLAGLALIEAHGAPRGRDEPFNVLIEIGVPGGRTGCRTADEALSVARAIAAKPRGEAFGCRVLRRPECHGRRRGRSEDGRSLDSIRCRRWRGNAMSRDSTEPRRSPCRPAGRRCSISWRVGCPCSCPGRYARSSAAAAM